MSEVYTLQQVAQLTRQSYMVVKKHAQRGKLQTVVQGRNRVVTEDGLAAYQAAEGLERVAEGVRGPETDQNALKTLREASKEAGNAISRLPPKVRDAILDGMPKTGKGGHAGKSEPFRNAVGGEIRDAEVLEEPDDDNPHGGKPVGFQWRETPRWKRTSESTWSLDGALWTWNGLMWEGGGKAEGRSLADDVSPANPYADKRPMTVSKGG